MAKTITIDSVTLYELRITRNAAGDLIVNGVFGILSGSKVVTTINTDATAILNSSERGSVGAVFGAVESAIARDQLS